MPGNSTLLKQSVTQPISQIDHDLNNELKLCGVVYELPLKQNIIFLLHEIATFISFYLQPKKFVPPPKITRAQIQEELTKQALPTPSKKTSIAGDDEEEPLPENLNRVQLEVPAATTIDEALSLLK